MNKIRIIFIAASFIAVLTFSAVSNSQDVPQIIGSADTNTGLASEFVVGDVHPSPGLEIIVTDKDTVKPGFRVISQSGDILSGFTIGDGSQLAQRDKLSGWDSAGLFRPVPDINGDGLDDLSVGLDNGEVRIMDYQGNLLHTLSTGVDQDINSPLAFGKINGENYWAFDGGFRVGTFLYDNNFNVLEGFPVFNIPSTLSFNNIIFTDSGLMLENGSYVFFYDLLGNRTSQLSLDGGEGKVPLLYSVGGDNYRLSYNYNGSTMIAFNIDDMTSETVLDVEGHSYRRPELVYLDNIPHAIRAVGNKIYSVNLVDKSVSFIDTGFDDIVGNITGDFDGDGNIDVFTSPYENSSFIGWFCYDLVTGQKHSWTPIFSGGLNDGDPLVSADLNGDGIFEAVFNSNYDNVNIVGLPGITGVNESLPAGFSLGYAFPNPFNSATTLSFELERKDRISINVYNPLGQIVRTLVDEDLTPGKHYATWNGKDNAGNTVSSGTYFFNLRTSDFSKTQKITFAK
ncbi:FlgD immunoglobulin-like domain containing protein [Candidatus Latescibacterota bacterium]